MDFELTLATEDDAAVFLNLWPLYQYDLSTVGGTLPNAFGVFEDEPIRVPNYSEPLGIWFRRPGFLFPYLIYVGGRAAGLALVGVTRRGLLPKDAAVSGVSDFFLHEFFILRPFRGSGIGRAVIAELAERHCGEWELWVLPENTPALNFWRKVLAELSSGKLSEQRQYQKDWESDAIIFRFGTRSAEGIG